MSTERDVAIDSGHPISFARATLGGEVYPWQREALCWYTRARGRTMGALVTPNGAGKSSGVVASLALWWASSYGRGKVVVTTKDAKQLRQQLYPALERHRSKLTGWRWVTSPCIEIRAPIDEVDRRGKIVAFTTNDAGRAEGWHKDDDYNGPLLIVVDEAKSVEEEIFRAIDRCTFNALLYVSSPGLMLGTFYDAFTKNAALFHRRQVSLEECPHIPKERIAGIIGKYGRKHPLTLSSVFGEFMNQDEATAFVFPLEIVQRATETEKKTEAVSSRRESDRSAYCDFAAGGDENVLAIRRGNRIEIAAAWRERDTMVAIGRFLFEFQRAGLKADEISADEGGLGKPMIDAIWSHGWEINRVNNGQRAHDPAYEDRGAEMWHETAAAMMRGEVIIPDDADLLAQLTTRKSRVTSDGRLGTEPKRELAKRGLPSPDRADAICGAWTCRAITVAPGFSSDHTDGAFDDEAEMSDDWAGMGSR